MAYPIYDVSSWSEIEEETLGSKAKVWLRGPGRVGWLFKLPRRGPGEHWAEKVAAEVAELVGVPHAVVELARYDDAVGTISCDLTNGKRRGVLAHGNMLMTFACTDYPEEKQKPREHAVETAARFLARVPFRPPQECPEDPYFRDACDVFVGYLMLDALIGNTDRHHENWAALVAKSSVGHAFQLAPSFDHASSLGREILDAEREERLTTRDRGRSIDQYCARAPSPWFSREDPPRPLKVREAFDAAAKIRPDAARAWRRRLADGPVGDLTKAIDQVPDELMTRPAREFARAVLECNRCHLLSIPRA